jgi:serine/threonine-protein kinase
MAMVFLAEDLKHHRPVAIKVLRPELAAALGPERFVREIETAARLNHPHILPLHDSGEADGFLYYVMPYVKGESLRDRLTRERQLSLDDALHIARNVANALSYAHSHHVVHRDIKPENILLAGDEVVVADFGIARAITAAEHDQLTATGMAIGTPAYISPEQAAGQKAVDGRCDIYSLGCVLYEMLAGDPPFTGSSGQAIMARKSVDPIPSLRTVRETIPLAIERAVGKALARVPADRFATATQFAESLREMPDAESWRPDDSSARHRRGLKLGLAIGALLVAIGVVGWWIIAGSRTRDAQARSVAILPCENLIRDTAQEYIADRWTEELIFKLSKVTDLRVKPWLSVSRYKGTTKRPREIANEIAAGSLLRCSVAQTTDSVQLTLQLIAAGEDAVIWSAKYARDLTAARINAIQGDAARGIAAALGAEISSREEAQLKRAPTRDLQAWELYRRGRKLMSTFTREAFLGSTEYFDRAIGRDSAFALAYAAKAEAILHIAEQGVGDDREDLDKVGQLARRALEIDEGLADAHTMLADYLLLTHLDWPTANYQYRRATQLNPGSVYAHVWYGTGLRLAERYDDAVTEGRRGVGLDPADPLPHQQLALDYLVAHQNERALEEARRAVELEPAAPYYLALGLVFKALERPDSAIAAVSRASQLSGETPQDRAFLAMTLAAAGKRERAKHILTGLESRVPEGSAGPWALALVYAELGDRDNAMKLLEKAYRERQPFLLPTMHLAPTSLRADPRFQDLRRRVGFDRW